MNKEGSIQQKTDQELVVLSSHDKESFAYLIDRYEEKLKRYVRRIGIRNEQEIQDILQNVFIKVYLNLAEFDSTLSFSSWIYRITHNETVSSYRKKKSRPQIDSLELNNDIIHSIKADIDISHEYDSQLTQNSIKNAVNSLDQKYSEVLLLRYFEEKSYDEISDILRISPNTVATRINRAKSKFKKLLYSQGFNYE